ncbi:MAG: quinone-dependent dihydroorotate dehydrogenase [Candidatus Thioglobus sp.]|nr:MAG: quinone-dependent dihydroorotate dehydrogenase [Candidatus Thioglobus sp.]
MALYPLIRPLLFRLNPEIAHHVVISGIRLAGQIHPLNQYLADAHRGQLPSHPTELMGLYFPNPVGVAAGLDKNGEAIDGLAMLGFGFLELGTVTPLAQAGNPKPRMFRLTEDGALINRMGFNGKGLSYLLNQLSRAKQHVPIGINLGRNATTSNENAWRDYVTGLRAVYGVADYVTINISSPNTTGLRDLQEGENLNSLLGRLKEEQIRLADQHQKYTPLVIKIAPDLDDEQLIHFTKTWSAHNLDGIIATNTTTTRPESLRNAPNRSEHGGLSGEPLASRSREVVKKLRQQLAPDVPIIGVGGIHDAESANAMLAAGANLIQIYTGLIYKGPGLLREILTHLKTTQD